MATNWDMCDTYDQLDREAEAEKGEDEEEGTISRPGSGKKSAAGDGQTETDIQSPSLKEKRAESAARKTMESRGTMGSSLAGSESMFAVRDDGISTDASDLQALEEERILKVTSLESRHTKCSESLLIIYLLYEYPC